MTDKKPATTNSSSSAAPAPAAAPTDKKPAATAGGTTGSSWAAPTVTFAQRQASAQTNFLGKPRSNALSVDLTEGANAHSESSTPRGGDSEADSHKAPLLRSPKYRASVSESHFTAGHARTYSGAIPRKEKEESQLATPSTPVEERRSPGNEAWCDAVPSAVSNPAAATATAAAAAAANDEALRNKCKQLEQEVESLKTQLAGAKETCEMLKKSSKEVNAKHDAQISKMEKELEAADQHLHSVVDPLTQENEGYVHALDIMRASATVMQSELDAKDKLIDLFSSALDKAYRANELLLKELKEQKALTEKYKATQADLAPAIEAAVLAIIKKADDSNCNDEASLEMLAQEREEASKVSEEAMNAVKQRKTEIMKAKAAAAIEESPEQHSQLTEVEIGREMMRWGKQYEQLCNAGNDPLYEPYCFDQESTPSNIRWMTDEKTGEKEPLCASLDKLVELVTMPSQSLNSSLIFQVLLTYRIFTSPQVLMRKLALRYRVSEYRPATEEHSIIRLRVFDVMCKWIERFPYDFASLDMQELVKLFAAGILKDVKKSATLINLVNTAQRRTDAKNTKVMKKTLPTLVQFDISAVSSQDIAQQLSLCDMERYTKITPIELLHPSNWSDPKKTECAPNVREFVARFNVLSSWVVYEVLQRPDPKDRAKLLVHFMNIAKACLTLKNYHAALAIATSLKSPALTRMRATQELFNKRIANKKDKQVFQELVTVSDCSGNFKTLRAAVEGAAPPCLPHLGLYLSDIFFIHEGNEDYVHPDDKNVPPMINLAKQKLLTATIQKILAAQHQLYKFEPDPHIMRYLNSLQVHSSDSLFEMSKRVEP